MAPSDAKWQGRADWRLPSATRMVKLNYLSPLSIWPPHPHLAGSPDWRDCHYSSLQRIPGTLSWQCRWRKDETRSSGSRHVATPSPHVAIILFVGTHGRGWHCTRLLHRVRFCRDRPQIGQQPAAMSSTPSAQYDV